MDQTESDVTGLADSGRALERTFERIGGLARGFSGDLVRGLKSAVGAGRQLDGVLASAALRISSRLVDKAFAPLETLMTQGLSALGGLGRAAGGSLLAARLGAAVDIGRVRPFAAGGVVAAPTFFPLERGLGVAGEAGAEAILPLARGADGRLGVKAGGDGGALSVVFNVSTPDADSFRRSEAQLSALIARTVARGRRGL